jgi:CheY-like chemotaxis protein
MNTAPHDSEKLVVVVDNHPLVLEATGSLFKSWGFRVIAAQTWHEAISYLTESGGRPDLIVCDYQLSEGATGVEAIEALRNAFALEIPALIISGDASSLPLRVETHACYLLHKPVDAETIRGVLAKASIFEV